MPIKKTVIQQVIEPILTLDRFGSTLAKMAPDLRKETDPLAYFTPTINHMENFALGIYQWCIVDFANQKLFEIGGMLEAMTGKPYEYWIGCSSEKYLNELAPPEVIPYWMAYVHQIYQYILQQPQPCKERALNPHIYMPMKNKEGVYKSMVLQFIDWMVEEDGGVRYCLCLITDVSHIKPDGPIKLIMCELKNGVPTLLVSEASPENIGSSLLHPFFSTREKQVLRLLASGLTSKMISAELGIAHNTVENHRQRLLKKAGCSTSSELIAYALAKGLI